jgi:hypothetical protein
MFGPRKIWQSCLPLEKIVVEGKMMPLPGADSVKLPSLRAKYFTSGDQYYKILKHNF